MGLLMAVDRLRKIRETTAIDRLHAIRDTLNRDPEAAHSEADDVLLWLAGDDVAAAYQEVVDACGWWACA
jgi:hypothetical protein